MHSKEKNHFNWHAFSTIEKREMYKLQTCIKSENYIHCKSIINSDILGILWSISISRWTCTFNISEIFYIGPFIFICNKYVPVILSDNVTFTCI